MMEKIICCGTIKTPRDFHRALQEALGFPEWYGHNLDALYDCLTSLPQTTLVLEDFEEMGHFRGGFLGVFLDAARENKHLDILFR